MKEGNSMQQDLSNAKVIAWEGAGGRTFVGVRQQPGERFRYDEGHPGHTATISESIGASGVASLRVLESFPVPSLSEVVGDAPAFLFVTADGHYKAIAWLAPDGTWQATTMNASTELRATHRTLESLAPYVDLLTVVPLVAREVSS